MRHSRLVHRFSQQGGAPSRTSNVGWEFGMQVHDGWPPWLHHRETPYHLNLANHSGIVVGQTEEGITMSLLQLARLAIRHGWKVVLFDPQTTVDHKATFRASMQAAGCSRIYLFPGSTHLADLDLKTSIFDSEMPSHGLWSQVEPLPPLPPELRISLEWMLNDGSESPFFSPRYRDAETASAAYVGVNVWSQPEKARALARALLTHIVKRVSEQAPGEMRMLLLLKHPELLFDLAQILPLFACMEQAQGSVFATTRSLEDFHWPASNIVKNARTIIAHRSQPDWSLSHAIVRHSSFDKTVCTLPDNECFVIHAGTAAHVRVNSIHPDSIHGANRMIPFFLGSTGVFAPILNGEDLHEDPIGSQIEPSTGKHERSVRVDKPTRRRRLSRRSRL
jgi:hypothetical protein